MRRVIERVKRAVYIVAKDQLLPMVRDAAPGKRAKQTFFVQKISETADSIEYGIKPDKEHRYINYTLPPGTPPHRIPKSGYANLFFVWNTPKDGKPPGARHFRYVLHPGYVGRDWVKPTLAGVDVKQLVIQQYKSQK